LNNKKGTIRAVNYHCTPSTFSDNFEKHVKFYNRHFRNINLNDLEGFFNSSKVSCPGIIITFDDGLRSNFDYSLSILEKYGLTGWFCIPVQFFYNPSSEFAQKNSILIKQNYSDNRYSMNLNELMILSQNHVIVSHTNSHYRFNETDTSDKLNFEILSSKIELSTLIGQNIQVFCWVGGELVHYTKNAYDKIIQGGYKFSFTTNNCLIKKDTDRFNLNRTNIETHYPMHLLLFQLSGLMDLLYLFKRKKVASKFYGNDTSR
jgi:hypothetical protein